jgi:hypothetical protein
MTKQEEKAYLEEQARQREARRCMFTFSDGRRCKMQRMYDDEDLCPFHLDRREADERAIRAGRKIAGAQKGALESPLDINHILENILRAVAEKRMPAKDAAILAYICQLAMQSIPLLYRQAMLQGTAQGAIHKILLVGEHSKDTLQAVMEAATGKLQYPWEKKPDKAASRNAKKPAPVNGSRPA